jgi:hypothetical protein
MKNINIINEIARVKNLMGISLINEETSKIGCNRYPLDSISRKLCSKLNTSEYRDIMYPLFSKMLEGKKRLWREVIPQEDQEYLFNTLNKLQKINSDKKWQWPCNLNGKKICYGTLDEFKETALSELSFIYDENSKWTQLNKLDTNYSDAAVLITDILNDSKTLNFEEILNDLNSEEILNDLNNNSKESLRNAVNTISNYSNLIYNTYLKDCVKYVEKSVHNSKEGEDVEKLIVDAMKNAGYTLLHPIESNLGQGGDPIDVLLGIDLIMESPGGEIVTIQCKKVWDIIKEPKTLMNPDEGAYRVDGKPYVSKQRNLDYVGYGTIGYGTKKSKVIVAKRQNDLIKQGHDYIYIDKKVLPTPQGNSSRFYIDIGSVITTNLKNN